ncbi:MAG: hypothetical protein JWN21_450 [Sphingomonas bacterium]|uniref:hypothetical protein n=1 Tax=Sphingomonas bacterium TaxID=1895847 RepID=UPI002631B7AD|nr:hypothetical protein [Sphingomonas bacterium]MDB5694907.1 hypothetical protein [Sphingomonas bacterium]
MEIIKLPAGETAPKESDCISVEEQADGTFELNTSALSACDPADDEESMAVIGSEPYPSYAAAEAAGLAIAAEQCVETVYISRS